MDTQELIRFNEELSQDEDYLVWLDNLEAQRIAQMERMHEDRHEYMTGDDSVVLMGQQRGL